MKLFFSIVVLFFSAFVFAVGPTTIHGLNEAGEEIRADVEESYENEPVRTPSHPHYGPWSVVVSDGKNQRREFKQQYCGYSGPSYGSGWSFSCAREGNSPLAGTSYDFREELDNCGGFLFICKSGCNRRAPRELIDDLWECPAAFEALKKEEECASKNRQGAYVTLIDDVVHLMDAPSTSGKVLRKLFHGTKAKFISGDGICTTIAEKTGQWIEVNITDKQTVETGWIFDAYVEYHNNP